MSSQPMASAVNYPYPFEVNVANYVPVKLDETNYSLWKKLMLNLITSHQLVGFVDGTIVPPPLPSRKEEENQEQHMLWMRSDGLVKGWIFSTVTEEILLKKLKKVRLNTAGEHEEVLSSPHESEEILPELVSLKTAREVWVALENTLAAPSKSESSVDEAVIESEDKHQSRYMPLYRAIRNADWENTTKFLEQEPSGVWDGITTDSETALMLAVRSSKRNDFVKKLLQRIKPEDLARQDRFGGTALHQAVFCGNNVAAKLLVVKNPELLKIGDKLGGLAVHYAAERGNREMVDYLMEVTKMDGDPNPFEGELGVQLLNNLVYGKLYVSHKLHAMFWDIAEKHVPMIKSVRETKLKHHQALKFVIDFCEEVLKSGSSKANRIFFSVLGDAAILGACEVVEEIVEVCPNGITYKRNSDQKSLFQLAIDNRQENVFNLIYQLDENQDTFLLKLDNLQNNALHTTGNFGDRQQLSLQANVAGAALQLQRELQWFKAVEKLLLPQRIYQRNSEDKTPQDVFTETHKNLVKDGEKWMKETASSCTIVAALIVTVVFAAAITVPGGLNNVDGLPIFLEDRVFFLFGMFDALALFSSTTSLLIFLSIFTSRYGEQDFLYSLPRKLIIGLVTLFLSVISMMIAFGATLKIVFGHKRAWFVIPVVVLSSLPITLFALLQFPLLLDIIRSTYYPGIFRKRSNRILY
ncbi:hypothetical protein Vadar_021125 [Vaccinium darrowii]|uniref:Uncharacterized protein n=1 Tax=Vaccinium darrowii TaxID=229202 RepID=A0ACB7XIZ6_9ERIC|nr:hypothetical protein Vadar_021125 [Vaccinium darrowii]